MQHYTNYIEGTIIRKEKSIFGDFILKKANSYQIKAKILHEYLMVTDN